MSGVRAPTYSARGQGLANSCGSNRPQTAAGSPLTSASLRTPQIPCDPKGPPPRERPAPPTPHVCDRPWKCLFVSCCHNFKMSSDRRKLLENSNVPLVPTEVISDGKGTRRSDSGRKGDIFCSGHAVTPRGASPAHTSQDRGAGRPEFGVSPSEAPRADAFPGAHGGTGTSPHSGAKRLQGRLSEKARGLSLSAQEAVWAGSPGTRHTGIQNGGQGAWQEHPRSREPSNPGLAQPQPPTPPARLPTG